MSDLSVKPGERGVIRIFALDLPPEHSEFLREPGAAGQLLGLETLDDTHVDIIRIKDLEELGLSGYLVEGIGLSPEQVAPDRRRLDALGGHVMVVRSNAFAGEEVELTPDPRLALVATFREPGTDWSGRPMQSDSAKPFSAPKTAPRKARAEARRTGAALFAVVMTLIVLGLLWIIF